MYVFFQFSTLNTQEVQFLGLETIDNLDINQVNLGL